LVVSFEVQREYRCDALSLMALVADEPSKENVDFLVRSWDEKHSTDLESCRKHHCTMQEVRSLQIARVAEETLTSSHDAESSGDSSRRGTKRSNFTPPSTPDQPKKARGNSDAKHWSEGLPPRVTPPITGPCPFHIELGRRHAEHDQKKDGEPLCCYSKAIADKWIDVIYEKWTEPTKDPVVRLDARGLANIVCFLETHVKDPSSARKLCIFQIYGMTHVTPEGVDQVCAYKGQLTKMLDAYKEKPDAQYNSNAKAFKVSQAVPDHHTLLCSYGGPEAPPGVNVAYMRDRVIPVESHAQQLADHWRAAGHPFNGGQPCSAAPIELPAGMGPIDPFDVPGIMVVGSPATQPAPPSPPSASSSAAPRVLKLLRRRPGLILVRKRRRSPRPDVAQLA
jgi:hypothetical protein